MSRSTPKVWFITGTSSGFGLAMTKAALKSGNKVVATLRKPEALSDLQSAYSSNKLLIIKLDVTNPTEIELAFAKAKTTFGRIDVVFNNAAHGSLGEIEGTPDDHVRSMFEVFFFAAANVSRIALQYFRENLPIGGLLLQNSSQTALQAVPGLGYYSATKAALEGFSEALSKEIDPAWNITITNIEPGTFKTKGVTVNAQILPRHSAYTNPSLPVDNFRRVIAEGKFEQDGDVEKAAEAFLKLAALGDSEKLPNHFPIHKSAINAAREKAKELNEAADKWESWSEDVYL